MRRAHLIDLSLLLLLASPALSQEPSKFTLPQASGGTTNAVTADAATCTDNQVMRADGTSSQKIQCSPLVVSDTTGDLTGPSGGFSIIGGTGATDELILDGSVGTAGNVKILATGEILNRTTLNVGYDWITFRNTGSIGWESGGSVNMGGIFGDTRLYRDGAGILAQRVVGTAQTYRIYGTYTDASNYERLSLSGVAGTSVNITAETAGTGGDNLNVTLTPAGTGSVVAVKGSASGPVVASSYGGMYEAGATTVIDVASAGTYYPWVSATAGVVSGTGYVTFTDGTPDSLTIGANGAGVYLVNVALSYSGTANSTAICKVYKEGVAQNNCTLKRKLGTGGDVGNTGLTCLLSLAASDDIALYCTADSNGDDVTVQEANLTITRVGF